MRKIAGVVFEGDGAVRVCAGMIALGMAGCSAPDGSAASTQGSAIQPLSTVNATAADRRAALKSYFAARRASLQKTDSDCVFGGCYIVPDFPGRTCEDAKVAAMNGWAHVE